MGAKASSLLLIMGAKSKGTKFYGRAPPVCQCERDWDISGWVYECVRCKLSVDGGVRNLPTRHTEWKMHTTKCLRNWNIVNKSTGFMTLWPWMISFSIKSQMLVKSVQCASSWSSCVSCFLHLHSVIEFVSLILPATAAVKTCSQPRRRFSS